MGCVQSSGVHDEAKACESLLPLLAWCWASLGVGTCNTSPNASLIGNGKIESQLKKDCMMAKNEIKMLLLGAGESGKVCLYLSPHHSCSSGFTTHRSQLCSSGWNSSIMAGTTSTKNPTRKSSSQIQYNPCGTSPISIHLSQTTLSRS
jgi:hypothetical protein